MGKEGGIQWGIDVGIASLFGVAIATLIIAVIKLWTSVNTFIIGIN